jgi:hypothetical protein
LGINIGRKGKYHAVFNKIFAYLPVNPRVREIYFSLKSREVKRGYSIGPKVLVECVEDPFYLCLFFFLINNIKSKSDCQIELFVPQSLNAAVGTSLKDWVRRLPPVSRLLSNQWVRVWSIISKNIAYRNSSILFSARDIKAAFVTWSTWRNLKSASDVEDIVINGIQCGDLIIDTYLRFRPSPYLTIRDFFLFVVIWQAHREVFRAEKYFRGNNVALYIATYTTYISHGIAARVAQQFKVSLISFGNFQDFGKFHGPRDIFQTRNAKNYAEQFALLSDGGGMLMRAKALLEARLTGKTDSATSYMQSSAYVKVTDEIPNVAGAVVIFLHDFYDSPHIYGEMIFSDFWEWVCFTIEVLNKEGIRCFIKPHPNQVGISDGVVKQLINKFPGIKVISPGITNRQLVDADIACAVTVYGTVAHEIAYMGVPVISCASHPHISFNFCRTARKKSEYAELLKASLSFDFDKEKMKIEVLQFYAMHNLNFSEDHIDFREKILSLWKNIQIKTASTEMLIESFESLAIHPHFNVLVNRLVNRVCC